MRLAALDRIRDMDVSGLLDQRPLALTIHYFTTAPMEGDIDNIVKPIMDALRFVAYLDDKDVERITVQRFDASFSWTFVGPSRQLATALGAARPMVYICIDDDLSWRRHA